MRVPAQFLELLLQCFPGKKDENVYFTCTLWLMLTDTGKQPVIKCLSMCLFIICLLLSAKYYIQITQSPSSLSTSLGDRLPCLAWQVRALVITYTAFSKQTNKKKNSQSFFLTTPKYLIEKIKYCKKIIITIQALLYGPSCHPAPDL